MSTGGLDPVLVPPKRLAVMGILATGTTVEFAFLREHLDLGDSDLSKQMSSLIDAGYAAARKTGRGADRRTWYRLTSSGDRALRTHLAALNALVQAAPAPRPPEHDPFEAAER